jgi:predicted O-methyltransferase YrrM
MTPHTSETLRDAFKYLYPDELPELKRLANLLPDNPHIVNLGSGSGTSSLAFLESRPDVVVTSIDKQLGDSPFGCLSAEYKVVILAGHDRRFAQVHSDSKVAGGEWDTGPVDMVFVDGDHSYEGCSGDIKAWLPNIKDGGILSIHDYQKEMLDETPNGPHPKPWPGVDDAVYDLLIGKYEIVSIVDSLISFRIKR